MATDTLTDTPESPPATLTALAPLRPHRITVEEYMRMADAGVFGPEPKLELIEGAIVDKMTKHTPHILVTNLIQDMLVRFAPPGTHVSMSNPITIVERQSEPEPDAMIVRGTNRDYEEKRVTPPDVLIVVEVAVTSVEIDRGVKRALYAASGIPVFWLVDIPARRLEVYTGPTSKSGSGYYAQLRLFEADHEVPLELDGQEIARVAVKEILPRGTN